jgi:hypothetical protein
VTLTELEPPRTSGPTRGSGRAAVGVVLIICLAASGFFGQLATRDRDSIRAIGKTGASAAASSGAASLNSMPSYATALLLGGLRGPLVMFLWPTSETHKQQHNLQDIDTEIEWIRLLQPEFDTVHLFQIWNKAYNISVQMASLANKYSTILDAIDYGQKVDRERPDDINIICAIAAIYGDKLGTSQEHVYYRGRVRRETQTLMRLNFPAARADEFRRAATRLGWSEDESPLIPNERTERVTVFLERPRAVKLAEVFNGSDVTSTLETRSQSQSVDPGWRRTRLDPVVDAQGNIFPDLVTPRFARPANLPADRDWYDGSQLQFLKQYEPFPYGVSTLAMAYNDYKRAQLLLRQWHEEHIQSGDVVIDSFPALDLKLWGLDELERGRHYELRMWGHPMSTSLDPISLEEPDASVPLTTPSVDDVSRDAAMYSYATAARLFHDSRIEYIEHSRRYLSFAATYFAHIDDTLSDEPLMQADHDYLAAMTATGAQRDALIRSAQFNYVKAAGRYALTILKYYMDDPIAAKVYPMDPSTGKRYTRASIEKAGDAVWLVTLDVALRENQRAFTDPATGRYQPMMDSHREDREQYLSYYGRCLGRLKALQAVSPMGELPTPAGAPAGL